MWFLSAFVVSSSPRHPFACPVEDQAVGAIGQPGIVGTSMVMSTVFLIKTDSIQYTIKNQPI